jgi:hypothetical protein
VTFPNTGASQWRLLQRRQVNALRCCRYPLSPFIVRPNPSEALAQALLYPSSRERHFWDVLSVQHVAVGSLMLEDTNAPDHDPIAVVPDVDHEEIAVPEPMDGPRKITQGCKPAFGVDVEEGEPPRSRCSWTRSKTASHCPNSRRWLIES